MDKHKGVALIGISGTGKTTIGPILAQKMGWQNIDLDYVMVHMTDDVGKRLSAKPIDEDSSGALVQEMYARLGKLLDNYGAPYVCDLEVETIAQFDLHNLVLSTPGSIIYDEDCHQQLKDQATVIWLDVPLLELSKRLKKDPWRMAGITGVAVGFENLLRAREPLYKALADITIQCKTKSAEYIADEIVELLENMH